MNNKKLKTYSFIRLPFEEHILHKKCINYCLLYFPVFKNNQNLCEQTDKKFYISPLFNNVFDAYMNTGLKYHHANSKTK